MINPFLPSDLTAEDVVQLQEKFASPTPTRLMVHLDQAAVVTPVLRPGITAVIAAHPARLRNGLLVRALRSVCAQTLQPEAVLIVNDKEKRGAGWTRRTILEQVNTTWMAWLDSDDQWYPTHLEDLYRVAEETDSKYVFSYFDGADPFTKDDPNGHFGRPFNPCSPHHTTITALVDVALAKEVGYPDTAESGPFSNEDWAFIVKFSEICCERGYKMTHLAKRTWLWGQAPGQNTSGRPDQGDAVL